MEEKNLVGRGLTVDQVFDLVVIGLVVFEPVVFDLVVLAHVANAISYLHSHTSARNVIIGTTCETPHCSLFDLT